MSPPLFKQSTTSSRFISGVRISCAVVRARLSTPTATYSLHAHYVYLSDLPSAVVPVMLVPMNRYMAAPPCFSMSIVTCGNDACTMSRTQTLFADSRSNAHATRTYWPPIRRTLPGRIAPTTS
eukprot:15257-Heterococcus_DN1.PRE.5